MPTRPGTGVACSLGARRAPNLNRLNLNYTWGPPIGALWGTAAPGTAPLWGGDPRGAGRCSFGLARALSHHSGFVDPRLLDVATGGVWDSFVLLPRILGCLGSFARAFLPGRLVFLILLPSHQINLKKIF